MVNNAGVAMEAKDPQPIWSFDQTVFEKDLNINVVGVLLGCKYASAQMIEQDPLPCGDRGWILNTASVFGLVGSPGIAGYVTSKHAVMGLTKASAWDCAPHRIHVNALCPGYTETAFIAGLEGQNRAQVEALHPFGGLGRPEYIARAALFLVSEDSSWVTGLFWSLVIVASKARHVGSPNMPLRQSPSNSISCAAGPTTSFREQRKRSRIYRSRNSPVIAVLCPWLSHEKDPSHVTGNIEVLAVLDRQFDIPKFNGPHQPLDTEIMPRCAFCRTFTVDQDRFYLEFHPKLASLKKSAEDGCDFCHLCWTGFRREWSGSEIESVLKDEAPEGVTKFEPGIWIYVHFTDYSPTLTQPRIIVSCGRYNPITSVKESSHGLSYINLTVYGKEGTAAGSRTPGRICTADYEPDSYLTLIQRFLERCTKSHQACGADVMYDMPTRVIDVGNGKQGDLPRLVVTYQSMKEKYLALSYCWGPGTDTFTLNHKTMEGMLRGIDESRLVAAHRDTITLTRQLGIRYIWIDALCIIQGDKDDWERESKLMAKVYGHATLTITAGRSGDARNSFIPNSYKQPAPCCEFPLGDGQGGNVIVGPLRSADYGITETRGWCCQEKRLSRRIVFFGKEQLFFLCRSSGYSEDRSYQEGKSILLHSFLNTSSGDTQLIRDRLLQYWDEIVVDFSRRQLSNPHDIFAALASIAAPISKALQSRYLAGLWECDLVRCLLWRPGYRVSSFFGPATRPLPTVFAPAPVIRAPSWSWASIQGGVKPLTLQQFRRMKTQSESGIPLIRPKQDCWTVDPHCGADALHMPSCELQLLGRAQEAIVLTRTPSSEFIASLRKQKRPAGTMRRPVVLGRKELKEGSLNKDMSVFQALGIFDFDEESIEEVWCLQLTLEEGLMLCKKDDVTFQRIGVFQLFHLRQ
ncbi:hypothetical protein FMEXI_7684 [Fusarium mexicanum]|uniref:Heterokaryon incompatibility domain-containing protein n=1 Tax=Fusarium mexicanum TaxID=751941 RepID=A0A8H5IU18_9HYPO|nr:hypothetical protein FMEXI_7684 [Fusarium mexicanum]